MVIFVRQLFKTNTAMKCFTGTVGISLKNGANVIVIIVYRMVFVRTGARTLISISFTLLLVLSISICCFASFVIVLFV